MNVLFFIVSSCFWHSQRKLRDITADIYVAERLGWPVGSGNDIKSVWEIAFTSATYLNVATDESASFEVQEPMRIWVKIPVSIENFKHLQFYRWWK